MRRLRLVLTAGLLTGLAACSADSKPAPAAPAASTPTGKVATDGAGEGPGGSVKLKGM